MLQPQSGIQLLELVILDLIGPIDEMQIIIVTLPDDYDAKLAIASPFHPLVVSYSLPILNFFDVM